MTSGASAQPAPAQGISAYGLVLLTALTIVWGFNWPFMKISLSEVTVLWFRTACVGIGGVLLLLMSLVSRDRVTVPFRQIPALVLCATFGIVGWHLFTGYGLTHMPAGRAAIIAFLMPVIASLLSSWLLGEALTVSKVTGLLVGMLGLGVLIGPDIVVLETAPVGALLMVGAAFSWAMGTVLYKKFAWSAPTSTVIGWQLLTGLAPIGIAAHMLEPVPDPTAISAPVWAAMAFVFLVPMVFGQWAYYKIVKMIPASIAAISTLAIPIVGVYSSAWMLGEAVGTRELASLGLICVALSIVLVIPPLLARRGARPSVRE